VLAQKDTLAGKNLRVSGNIVTESVTYDTAKLDLNFLISDPADASKTLPVYFHGVQPDQISREGASAIVEGSLGPGGAVQAHNLLLKCPSRYEEQGMEEIQVEAIK
jgi:cytochrome c-type biogenesis protein CcmE